MNTPAAHRPFGTGVVFPVCTPLTRYDDIDVPSLRRHLDHLITHGADGVFVLGTCGEFAFLTDAQRVEVVRTARDPVDGPAPVGPRGPRGGPRPPPRPPAARRFSSGSPIQPPKERSSRLNC